MHKIKFIKASITISMYIRMAREPVKVVKTVNTCKYVAIIGRSHNAPRRATKLNMYFLYYLRYYLIYVYVLCRRPGS